MQPLEGRRLLSGATLSGGVLTVEGTAGPDEIEVQIRADEPNVVKVEINNLNFEREFDRASVQRIVVNAFAGNDSVEIGKDDEPVSIRAEINGGTGNDFLDGGASGDIIRGEGGNDNIDGEGGNDRVFGNAGNDSIEGSGGNDTLSGGSGHDTLQGGSGRDLVSGEAGNDRLEGRSGDDRLFGGSGTDTLEGGAGTDELTQ
jgi:Ca2+-binding RTX toxin-like protein